MDKTTDLDAEGIPGPIGSLMRAAKISINGLALVTHIPYTTLRRRLHEPELLTMGDLLRIADALGVAPTDLLPATFTAVQVA